LLDTLLSWARQFGLLKARGRQRTDSTHVLAAVRALNRLERVGETLRAALNSLAVVAPDWLRGLAPPEWYERYGPRVDNYRLPKTDTAREALAASIGADGVRLLQAVDAALPAPWLREVPAVVTLRRVWTEQYAPAEPDPHSPGGPAVRGARSRAWPRPPTSSPLRTTWRPAGARRTAWSGSATSRTSPKRAILTGRGASPTWRRRQRRRQLTRWSRPCTRRWHDAPCCRPSTWSTPGTPLAGASWTVSGRTASHSSARWRRRQLAGARWRGFAKRQFRVDWDRRVVTCPQGRRASPGYQAPPADGHRLGGALLRRDCTPCPARVHCTRATREPASSACGRASTRGAGAGATAPGHRAFRTQDARRAGSSTHAQGTRRCGLRQARYTGLAKTHLQHLATAAALNLVRLGEWWLGARPATTRRSPFAALRPCGPAALRPCGPAANGRAARCGRRIRH
jgi:transposase